MKNLKYLNNPFIVQQFLGVTKELKLSQSSGTI